MNVDVGQVDACGAADSIKARPDDVQCIFSGEQHHSAGPGDCEATEAGLPRGDGDGHVEGEKGLTAFGLSANNADSLFGPQAINEPAMLFGADCKQMSGLNRESTHRARPCVSLGFGGGEGTAKASK